MCALVLVATLLLVSCSRAENARIQDDHLSSDSIPKVHTSTPIHLLLAGVTTGPHATAVTSNKVFAALQLIDKALPGYASTPVDARDSIVRALERRGAAATAQSIGAEVGADRLLFVRVDRLENILRIALTIRYGDAFDSTAEGVGYALIRYRREGSEERIYDPAVLAALQRALAMAERSHDLFADCEGVMRIRPAAQLVVSGLGYRDEPGAAQWTLFEEKIISAYSATLDIIATATDDPRFVVYDIDSRDSLYALQGLYYVENYREPTETELAALSAFGVRHLISGTFVRAPHGADLSLSLCLIKSNRCNSIATVTSSLSEDSHSALQSAVWDLTTRLLQSLPETELALDGDQ